MSQREDVILEAKRILVNNDLDTINEFNFTCPQKSAKVLDWNNELFWKDLPNPKNNCFNKKSKKLQSEYDNRIATDSVFGDVLPKIVRNNAAPIVLSNKSKYLSEKYFIIWKNAVVSKKEQKNQRESEVNQQLKLETFIKKLKKRSRKNGKSKKLDNEQSKTVENSYVQCNTLKLPSSTYKNRYDAQKTIIQMQKAKLEEQNKIIQDLKVGIISDDLLKSIENTKTNIREIFGNCSTKNKYKIPMILSDESRFIVSSHKVPKIVQRLEQRALQRAQNRETILERKRIIEETRQKMLIEAMEKKRVLEEEEKIKSLELIKERRQKEMEAEKIRQINKQKYMEKLHRAVNFHNNLLLKECIKRFFKNVLEARRKYSLAVQYFEHKTLKTTIYQWLILVESTYKIKYEIANAHFEYKLLKRSLRVWHEMYIDSVRNMQVAEDFFDFRLTSNIFIHWNRYACLQYMKEHKNMKIAEAHHKRWILFHYFYLWRSLKAINELEKAKELKKTKWRLKVWEVLPDYKPPQDV